MSKVIITFVLDTEEDPDILRWLKEQDRRGRSAAIRKALRAYMRSEVTLGDIYQAVRDLERKLKTGAVALQGTPAEANPDWEEPPDLAAALDALAHL